MATTPQIFDLPAELNSIIFISLSLREIGRLRRCCLAWKNKLHYLSFLTVLDFSYSPNITKEAFDELISKRINTKKNNIRKVIIYHATHLEESWLENLFRALPRVTHVRIGFLPSQWLRRVLQLEQLEDVSYRALPTKEFVIKKIRLNYFKCTKLKRLKLQDVWDFYCDQDPKFKLAKTNPALKNDVYFKKFIDDDAGRNTWQAPEEQSTKQLDNCLRWYKQRPFLEFLLSDHVSRLQSLFGTNREKFDEELNHWIQKVDPVLLPSGIRSIYARILASKLKYEEAYNQYFSLLDPNFKMTYEERLSEVDRKDDPYFGAYHMAKDYLNSPELLQRLNAVNTHNYEVIATQYTTLHKHYTGNQCTTLQEQYDAGKCTQTAINGRVNQYKYSCVTCKNSGISATFCYSCAKTCHAGHEVVFGQLTWHMCNCTHCH